MDLTLAQDGTQDDAEHPCTNHPPPQMIGPVKGRLVRSSARHEIGQPRQHQPEPIQIAEHRAVRSDIAAPCVPDAQPQGHQRHNSKPMQRAERPYDRKRMDEKRR